jgi:hypothetical protein
MSPSSLRDAFGEAVEPARIDAPPAMKSGRSVAMAGAALRPLNRLNLASTAAQRI